MSAAVWRQMYQTRSTILGPDDPCTRGAFGRWVGARGGVLSRMGSGTEAWVGCYRERGNPGFHNRSFRRATFRLWATGSAHQATQRF